MMAKSGKCTAEEGSLGANLGCLLIGMQCNFPLDWQEACRVLA